MIDINEIEEGILIETEDFNMGIENLYNDIKVRGKNLSDDDARRTTCSIIGSMVLQGLSALVKSRYRLEDDDLYEFQSQRDLTPEERELILTKPELWEENGVFSMTEVYELAITDKGREKLTEIVG